MERKILTIMVALMVVAAIVVAFVMIAAGGVRTAGGFTRLFDDLENPNPTVTFHQYLELPDDWSINDVKTVSDTIVDMYLDYTTTVGSSTIYVHVIYFVCISDKWTDAEQGTSFFVPSSMLHSGYIQVDHGRFSLSVSSVSNLSEDYTIGDVIELDTVLADNLGVLSFGSWSLASE
jgi:hypothetical protein